MKKKKSFLQRLTGAVKVNDFDDDFELEEEQEELDDMDNFSNELQDHEERELPAEDGELSVDVLTTPEEIIIKAMVAGVKPQDLDIQITRDMVTIRGTREEIDEV